MTQSLCYRFGFLAGRAAAWVLNTLWPSPADSIDFFELPEEQFAECPPLVRPGPGSAGVSDSPPAELASYEFGVTISDHRATLVERILMWHMYRPGENGSPAGHCRCGATPAGWFDWQDHVAPLIVTALEHPRSMSNQ